MSRTRFAAIDQLDSTYFEPYQPRPSVYSAGGQRPGTAHANRPARSLLSEQFTPMRPVPNFPGTAPLVQPGDMMSNIMDPNSSIHYPPEQRGPANIPDWFMAEFQQRVWTPPAVDDPVRGASDATDAYTDLKYLSDILKLGDAVAALPLSDVEHAKLFMKLFDIWTKTQRTDAIAALFSVPKPMLCLVQRLLLGRDIGKSDEENASLDQQCSVCQEQYRLGDRLVTLVCQHEFHHRCIGKWLLMCNKTTCPLCNAEVKVSRNPPPTTTTRSAPAPDGPDSAPAPVAPVTPPSTFSDGRRKDSFDDLTQESLSGRPAA